MDEFSRSFHEINLKAIEDEFTLRFNLAALLPGVKVSVDGSSPANIVHYVH
jgi:hypothetical protein